jgi:integrase
MSLRYASARKRSSDHLPFVLLGGDAGLRAGEIRGLHWTSIDLRRRLITLECSEYKGEFTTPKHDKIRTMPMTARLAAALAARKGGGGPPGVLEGRRRAGHYQHGGLVAAKLPCTRPAYSASHVL